MGVVHPLWVRRWGSTIMNSAVRLSEKGSEQGSATRLHYNCRVARRRPLPPHSKAVPLFWLVVSLFGLVVSAVWATVSANFLIWNVYKGDETSAWWWRPSGRHR